MTTGVAVFLVHLLATLAMTGVIWMVQLVHYPLFARVGAEGFRGYETEHKSRITWIVGPLMLLELATAIALVAGVGPEAVPPWMRWAGLSLVGVVWGSTAFLQVPLHTTLSEGYDGAAHRRLVATNWIRTAAWSLRAVLVLAMTALALHP